MRFNIHGLQGGAPIFDAIDHDDLAEVRRLAGRALGREDRRHGLTPVMYAAYTCRAAALRVLLDAGESANDVFRRDNDPRARSWESHGRHDGFTALHFCIFYNGDPEIVRLLLACGARGDLSSSSGWLPIELATAMNHREAADMLRRHAEHST